MKLIQDTAQASEYFSSRPSVTLIGNFDGGHVGHQQLIEVGQKLALEKGLHLCLLTFEPLPWEYFNKAGAESRLFTYEQRIRFLQELDVSSQLQLKFTADVASLEPDAFAHQILKKILNAKLVVVGENFLYGKGRSGNVGSLIKSGQSHGFEVNAPSLKSCFGGVVSSSRVRREFENDFNEAIGLLGRPYLVEGKVVEGQKIGRDLGAPTANLGDIKQKLPGSGVYCGWISVGCGSKILSLPEGARPAVFNLGYRPTVSTGTDLVLEGHLIQTRPNSEELYGKPVGFYLAEFIRKEKKFPDLDSLRKQITADVKYASKLLESKKFSHQN